MVAITIVVVALLTCLIFGLAIISFVSCIKSERTLIANGEKDAEILKEDADGKKKSSKIINAFSWAFSIILMVGIVAMAGTAIGFKAQGQRFSINNQTQLVIASDSMDGFYNDEYRLTLPEDAEKRQFGVGDILTFDNIEEDDSLEIYEVYGYQTPKGKIITHRLIGYTSSGLLVFRGDNTAGRDNYVKREQVILRYTGKKINDIGLFVLFSQSGFGIYSLISVIGVYAISEAFLAKYKKMTKARLEEIGNEK